ncbi:hypothetical protein EDB19DRAFT_921956 [Suillus lakei]|nr:hypothetical protein EDB19DRAFT_921956 [Suillus lakei]
MMCVRHLFFYLSNGCRWCIRLTISQWLGACNPLRSAALATFWIYDYVCSLHEEWTFLLRSRWTKAKVLYIIARYLPFFFITAELYLTFALNENPNKCRTLVNIYSCFGMISLFCSECMSPPPATYTC